MFLSSDQKYFKIFMILFSGNGNLPLAKKISKVLGIKLGKIEIKKFADGETYVNVKEDIKAKKVCLCQSCSFPTNENLMELLIMIDAIKRLSPKKIVALIPFYAYRRQEKKVAPGESITADLVARLIEEAGVDKTILFDIHSPKILKFFKKSVKNVSSLPLFIQYFKKKRIKNLKVMAPDKGAFSINKKFAGSLGVACDYLKKSRKGKHDIVPFMELASPVFGKNIIMLDDEISTAGTLIKASELLKKAGAKKIYVAVTHGVFASPAISRLKRSPLEEIIITDSIFQPKEKSLKKIKILSCAKILAREISKA